MCFLIEVSSKGEVWKQWISKNKWQGKHLKAETVKENVINSAN